jgi:hypothetical protein
MISNKELKNAWKISTINKVALFEPDERFILWIVANDPRAFSLDFNMEMAEKGLVKPNTPDANAGKALGIFLKLVQRGFIKNVDHTKNKVTWRGQLHRFYTHPSINLFIGILAIGV